MATAKFRNFDFVCHPPGKLIACSVQALFVSIGLLHPKTRLALLTVCLSICLCLLANAPSQLCAQVHTPTHTHFCLARQRVLCDNSMNSMKPAQAPNAKNTQPAVLPCRDILSGTSILASCMCWMGTRGLHPQMILRPQHQAQSQTSYRGGSCPWMNLNSCWV